MKEIIINKAMNHIKKKGNYSEEKLAEIKYGLSTLYINITKTIVIFTLDYFLGIIKELLLILLFYGLLRLTGFGLHAKKSWQCWIGSLFTFLLLPFLVKALTIKIYIRIIISILSIIFIAIYAPADTEKRPLIRKNRRILYKIICTITAIILTIYSFYIKNTLIQNSILFSLMLECIMISPLSYKIFKLKYANYKNYKKPLPA